jgi:glycosyltransferase involved in cell wall biosynthesis
MVEAMGLLPECLDAELTVVGGIPADLRPELEAKPGWARVDYRGPLPFDEMLQAMLEARVAVLPFLATAHHLTSYPNKLFEYMAAGLPVVATDMPHWRELVGDVGCVRWVDPERPETMAQAIGDLLNDPEEAEEMGRRGREAVEDRRLSWEAESRKLIELYRDLLARPPRPVP